jgi:hypothetical protein
MWLLFSQAFTVLGLIALFLYVMPLPFFDHNSATLMCAAPEKRIATARALSAALGHPAAELNTNDAQRFLFRDGTSVDSLVHPPSFALMYRMTALKSVVLGLFSATSPVEVARDVRGSLERDGFKVQLVTQPDSAFPDGATVLVLSDAFQSADDSGFGLIVRKHALRVGGQRATLFRGWPS